MILTDGQSNTGQVSGPAQQLKNSGVVIFSVGIGQIYALPELQVMASDPIDQHVITLSNFTELERLAEQMASRTCNGRCICELVRTVAESVDGWEHHLMADIWQNHSIGNDSRATHLKFVYPRISHCASHYHYTSKSIAFCGQ